MWKIQEKLKSAVRLGAWAGQGLVMGLVGDETHCHAHCRIPVTVPVCVRCGACGTYLPPH